MDRNVLLLIIGVLAVVVAVLGYHYYEERQRTGIEITTSPGSISIQKK